VCDLLHADYKATLGKMATRLWALSINTAKQELPVLLLTPDIE
jgi:hypothetical protein